MPKEESKVSWQSHASSKNKKSLEQLATSHLQGHSWGLRKMHGQLSTFKAFKTSQENFRPLDLISWFLLEV